jgi:hypothetical protein
MDDRDRHVHRCPCGTRWDCSKPDCILLDECTACEVAALNRWGEANGFLQRQMVLEPVDALIPARKDGQ